MLNKNYAKNQPIQHTTNKIILRDISIDNDIVLYKYDVDGDCRRYFNLDCPFYAKYENLPVSEVPKSILVIPWLSNILPLAWLCDAEIVVDECDADFIESIPCFKKGYIDMYPMFDFKGEIKVNNIVRGCAKLQQNETKKSASLFSGGVDATFTMLSNLSEKPALITLMWYDDIEGENNIRQLCKKTANVYNLDYIIINTAIRKFLNAKKLSNLVKKSSKKWWYGFQHGIGIIGHAAPYVYLNNINVLRIASSYTVGDKSASASDPTIDNYVRFFGCQVIHDGYEYSRQEKIKKIIEKTKDDNIYLRVCASKSGKNCSRCEKCFRTMMAILAEGGFPNLESKYGFEWDKRVTAGYYKKMFLYYWGWQTVFWGRIQERFLETHTAEDIKIWGWFLNCDLPAANKGLLRRTIIFLKKIKSGIYALINSLFFLI